MRWAEESEEVILDWWTSPQGDSAILACLHKLVSDVESDSLDLYKITELAAARSEWVIDLPIHGVCVVVEIYDDRVSLLSILTDHPTEDDFEPP